MEVISKKQRKSSRFYNCVLRKTFSDMSRFNQTEVFRQKICKDRRTKFERMRLVKAPPLYLTPAATQREQKITKKSWFAKLLQKVLG